MLSSIIHASRMSVIPKQIIVSIDCSAGIHLGQIEELNHVSKRGPGILYNLSIL